MSYPLKMCKKQLCRFFTTFLFKGVLLTSAIRVYNIFTCHSYLIQENVHLCGQKFYPCHNKQQLIKRLNMPHALWEGGVSRLKMPGMLDCYSMGDHVTLIGHWQGWSSGALSKMRSQTMGTRHLRLRCRQINEWCSVGWHILLCTPPEPHDTPDRSAPSLTAQIGRV